MYIGKQSSKLQKPFSIIFKMPGLRLQNPLQETHQAAHRFRRPIVANILQDDSPPPLAKYTQFQDTSNIK